MNSPEYQREQDRIMAGEPTVDANYDLDTELFNKAKLHASNYTLKRPRWYWLRWQLYAAMLFDGLCGVLTLGLWCPDCSVRAEARFLDYIDYHP